MHFVTLSNSNEPNDFIGKAKSFMCIKKVNRVYFDFTFTVIAAILWSTKNTNLIVPAQSQ